MLERRREGAVEPLRLDRQAVRNALDLARLAELPPAAAVSTKRFFAQLAGADELDRLAAPA